MDLHLQQQQHNTHNIKLLQDEGHLCIHIHLLYLYPYIIDITNYHLSIHIYLTIYSYLIVAVFNLYTSRFLDARLSQFLSLILSLIVVRRTIGSLQCVASL